MPSANDIAALTPARLHILVQVCDLFPLSHVARPYFGRECLPTDAQPRSPTHRARMKRPEPRRRWLRQSFPRPSSSAPSLSRMIRPDSPLRGGRHIRSCRPRSRRRSMRPASSMPAKTATPYSRRQVARRAARDRHNVHIASGQALVAHEAFDKRDGLSIR